MVSMGNKASTNQDKNKNAGKYNDAASSSSPMTMASALPTTEDDGIDTNVRFDQEEKYTQSVAQQASESASSCATSSPSPAMFARNVNNANQSQLDLRADIVQPYSSDNYRLYLLLDNQDKTLVSLQINVKAANAVVLYPDSQDISTSSRTSVVRKYNAYLIKNGKWEEEAGQRKKVVMGNLKINIQGLLTANNTTNYKGIIEDALLKFFVRNSGENLFRITPEAIVKNLLYSDLTLRDASLFSRTNKEFYDQLHSHIEVERMLFYIAGSKQEGLKKAEKMIAKFPGLLLPKGYVKDYEGYVFEKITAFQYAVWRNDKLKWEMILKYLPHDKARRQLQELENTRTYDICLLSASVEPKEVGVVDIKKDDIEDNILYVKAIPQIKVLSDYYCKNLTIERLATRYLLQYRVRASYGQIKEGIVNEAELGFSIEKDKLNTLLPAILKVTAKRKHTVGHGVHFNECAIQKINYSPRGFTIFQLELIRKHELTVEELRIKNLTDLKKMINFVSGYVPRN